MSKINEKSLIAFDADYSFAKLRSMMEDCEQTNGMSVLQHGQMVARYFEDLRSHIINGTDLKYEWKLPEWVTGRNLWGMVLPLPLVGTYHEFHDCGKPFCLEVDSDGKRHFPEHAKMSKSVWLKVGRDKEVGELIGMDMDIHLLKDSGVDEFSSRKEAATLLLTGLSEIHANSSLFGGIESTSFKIKFKQINKRGKKIVSRIQNITK